MNIAIIGHHSEFAYSGGRYHAWAMGEALQLSGNQVSIYTTNQPEFSYDFANYTGHDSLYLYLSPDLNKITPKHNYDVTIVIPFLTYELAYFENCVHFANDANSKIVLMNFESGNWFNEVSPFKRDLKLWDGYLKLIKNGGLILSSTKTSQDYAKKFYGENKKVFYAYSNPAINNLLADQAKAIHKNENSILICSRFSDKHKGGQDIIHLFCEELSGYTFKFIIGSGEFNRELWHEFFYKAREFDIRLKLLKRLDDLTKFEELKSCEALVFPSYFEGFGYPPVEARYCNIPCVVYDLEVLREVNGDEACYVPMGSKKALRNAVVDIIQDPPQINYKRPIQTVESFGEELSSIFKKYLES